MSILQELNSLFSSILPVETGIFSVAAPDEYLVLTPMTDTFVLYGDNRPVIDVSDVRISLYSKGNYIKRKNQLLATLLGAEFTITGRRYMGHEDDTGYHHYVIDVAKHYEMEE